MKLIIDALPPEESRLDTINAPIYEALANKSVGDWIAVTEIATHKAAMSKRNNILTLVKRNGKLGAGYGITTAIRPANDGTWTLSISKVEVK